MYSPPQFLCTYDVQSAFSLSSMICVSICHVNQWVSSLIEAKVQLDAAQLHIYRFIFCVEQRYVICFSIRLSYQTITKPVYAISFLAAYAMCLPMERLCTEFSFRLNTRRVIEKRGTERWDSYTNPPRKTQRRFSERQSMSSRSLKLPRSNPSEITLAEPPVSARSPGRASDPLRSQRFSL